MAGAKAVKETFQSLMERMTKELPDAQQKIVNESISNLGNNASNAQKSRIVREALNNYASSQAHEKTVAGLTNEFGSNVTEEILSSAKSSGRSIKEVAEQFRRNPAPDYSNAKGRKDFINQIEESEVPSGWHRKENPGTALMAPDDVQKMQQRQQEIFDNPSNTRTSQEYEKLFNGEPDSNSSMTRKEFDYHYNPDGTPRTPEQQEEFLNAERRRSEAARQNADDYAKQQRQEKLEKLHKERLEKEQAETIEKATKEHGGSNATKQREEYDKRKRLDEFEDTKERGVIGMAFHKLGNGISAAFGVQNVKTNAAGEVVNEFAARNTLRTNMNAFNRHQAEIGGAKISSRDFNQQYGAIREDIMGDFSQNQIGRMQQSSNFDGLDDWAKEHPMLVAGAIAGTAIGGASIISNMRGGD